jgi:hypothetical protein
MKRLVLLILLLQSLPLFAQHADSAKYVMPPPADTAHVKSALELAWEQQTQQGLNAMVEKATAGFFNTGRNAGIYAFYTTAPRGTVLKVRNLNNDRIIYVKVLGPLPNTKAFAGCTLGLSNDAKTALDVRNTRVLCEISYMGN